MVKYENIMLDYRKCSEESYKRAMASKDKDIRRIPREYLYILYTKYKADAVKLRAVDMEKALEAKRRKQMYWNELCRRKTELE